MQIDFFENLKAWATAQIPAAKLVKLFARNAIGRLSRGVKEMGICRAFMVHGNDGLRGRSHRHLAISANVEQVHAIVVITHAF